MRHSCVASATIILRSSKVRFFDPGNTTPCRSPPNSADGYAAVAKLYWFVLRATCIMDVILHRMLADTCVKPEISAVLDHLQRSRWRIRHPYAVWLVGKLQSPEHPGTCSVKGWDCSGSLKLVFIVALGHGRALGRHVGGRANDENKAARLAGMEVVFLSGVQFPSLQRGHNGGPSVRGSHHGSPTLLGMLDMGH